MAFFILRCAMLPMFCLVLAASVGNIFVAWNNLKIARMNLVNAERIERLSQGLA